MTDTKVPKQWANLYWEQFRVHVHTILLNGYQLALNKIRLEHGCEETAITGFLVEGMRKWLITGPGWCDGFHIDEDRPVPGKTKFGKEREGRNRQRPDIIILYANRPRPEYFFEAKRLRKMGDSGEYTTSKGMGCFINGEYAPDYDEAAMLGYIEIESSEYWRDFLKKEIDVIHTELFLLPPQRDINVIPNLDAEWKSGHDRNGIGRPIDILHILLDCRPCSS